MSGTGWSRGSGSCTTSTALAGGPSYAPITVSVNVASNAASSVTNQVGVPGGGSSNASATDQTSVSTASQSNGTVMDISYTYTFGQNNGRITQSKDYVLGQTSNYTYDSLNRLSTLSIVETQTGQQMTYDGFGNLTGMNGAAVWTHNPATNQVQMTGWSYDGNGRVLTDPNGS